MGGMQGWGAKAGIATAAPYGWHYAVGPRGQQWQHGVACSRGQKGNRLFLSRSVENEHKWQGEQEAHKSSSEGRGATSSRLRQCNSMGSRGSSRGGETQVAGARTAADMARAAGAAMARTTGTISNEEVAQTISVVPHLV